MVVAEDGGKLHGRVIGPGLLGADGDIADKGEVGRGSNFLKLFLAVL